ncbi:hypothetical protein DRR68_18140 [Escherichia coli]|nr:hypothetical protein [Escherichia coli]
MFSCVVRRLRFSGPKTSIICSPMTSLKTSIKTITYLSDIGCLEIHGASLSSNTEVIFWHSFPFAGNTKREYYGVILRQKKEINGSVIYPALSLSPTILNDEKRKWLTEYTTRQNTTMSLRRVTLRPGLAGNLITGQILPVSLFNTSLLPW